MTLNILIVDDSKLARMAAAKALLTLRPHWRRLEAVDAGQALEVARAQPLDIALVDFNMPGKDGLALAAELLDLQPNMQVGIVTANLQDEILDRAAELGAEFLPKPLSEASLARFLERVQRRTSTDMD